MRQIIFVLDRAPLSPVNVKAFSVCNRVQPKKAKMDDFDGLTAISGGQIPLLSRWYEVLVLFYE
jgi:hypothetical protein